MANRTTFDVTLTASRWLVLLALVFAAMGVSIAWLALRRMGAFPR